MTLKGHTDSISCVGIIPDGRRVVSGSWDSTLQVWDLKRGECLMTLRGHTDSINCVGILPDGRRAVSGGGDSTLRVWDLKSGECVAGHQARDMVLSISEISTHGHFACSTNQDEVLLIITDSRFHKPWWKIWKS